MLDQKFCEKKSLEEIGALISRGPKPAETVAQNKL